MREFEYKEIDTEGLATLDAVAEADRFNAWMYQAVSPYCSGKILEIGSGIGNISDFFVKKGSDITLSDVRSSYCNILKNKFPEINDIVLLDLTHPFFESEYEQHLEKFDSVFALNVVEHIKDDSLAINNCYKLLKPGGRLIILVPAYPKLYNRFDKELEHFRRYTKKVLNQLLIDGKFRIQSSFYFNFMGIPGWIISGKLQKNKTIPKSQMSFYNKLVPLFKLIDKCLFNRAGLSVVSVGVKE